MGEAYVQHWTSNSWYDDEFTSSKWWWRYSNKIISQSIAAVYRSIYSLMLLIYMRVHINLPVALHPLKLPKLLPEYWSNKCVTRVYFIAESILKFSQREKSNKIKRTPDWKAAEISSCNFKVCHVSCNGKLNTNTRINFAGMTCDSLKELLNIQHGRSF